MSDHVPAKDIEDIVGRERHPTDHYSRAVSTTQTVYVLHSQRCVDSGRDLATCRFSVALDKGINHVIPAAGWSRLQDRTVRVEVFKGFLVPEYAAIREAIQERQP